MENYKIIILLFIFICVDLNSQPDDGFKIGWEIKYIKNILPDNYLLSMRSIEFSDSLNGIIGCNYPNPENPAFLKTTDGGLNWKFTWQDQLEYAKDSTGQILKDSLGNILYKHLPSRLWDISSFKNTSIAVVSQITKPLLPYLLKSTDYGESWKVIDLNKNEVYKKVKLIDSLNGYLMSGINIYTTTDAGVSWNKMNCDYSYPDYGYWNMQVINDSIIYLVGMDSLFHGSIIKSNDKGKSWKRYELPDTLQNVINFVSDSIGFYTGYYRIDSKNYGIRIWKTIDGGSNWQKQFDTTSFKCSYLSAQSIIFKDKSTGVLIGSRSDVYTTTDGGKNWIDQAPYKQQNRLFTTVNGCYKSKNEIFLITELDYSILSYNINPSNIEEEIDYYKTIKLSPNPVNDFLKINATPEIHNIEIFTSLGVKVIDTEWQDKINLSCLPSGIYILKIGNRIGKFIKL